MCCLKIIFLVVTAPKDTIGKEIEKRKSIIH